MSSKEGVMPPPVTDGVVQTLEATLGRQLAMSNTGAMTSILGLNSCHKGKGDGPVSLQK